MRFAEEGPEDAPVALLVHPMLVDERCFRPLTQRLAGRYRFVLPTLDGHYDGSPDFASAVEEARGMAAWLQGRGIDRIEVLLGASLGGAVALEMLGLLGDSPCSVGRAVVDGAPLFDSRVVHAGFVKEARRMRDLARAGSPEATRASESFFSGHGDELIACARRFSDASLEAVAAATCRARLPRLPEGTQRRLTFAWGMKELAFKSASRVLAAYPHARVAVKRGLDHCGYLTGDPDGYAAEFFPA